MGYCCQLYSCLLFSFSHAASPVPWDLQFFLTGSFPSLIFIFSYSLSLLFSIGKTRGIVYQKLLGGFAPTAFSFQCPLQNFYSCMQAVSCSLHISCGVSLAMRASKRLLLLLVLLWVLGNSKAFLLPGLLSQTVHSNQASALIE